MSTDEHRIEVSGIPVDVVRKDIKNLHLAVYPPEGSVRVAVPTLLDDDAVRLAIVSRIGWIRRQQALFQQQDRQSRREMVAGESHYVWGRRYRLRIVEGSPEGITLKPPNTMLLAVREGAGLDRRQQVLTEWYRGELKAALPGIIAGWEPVVGVDVAECRVRKMRTKWGSCNAEDRRLWFNLDLVKKRSECLEYIAVHEMVHLLERRHNDRFRSLMNEFMPQWRQHRAELNRAPLAHEDWTY